MPGIYIGEVPPRLGGPIRIGAAGPNTAMLGSGRFTHVSGSTTNRFMHLSEHDVAALSYFRGTSGIHCFADLVKRDYRFSRALPP